VGELSIIIISTWHSFDSVQAARLTRYRGTSTHLSTAHTDVDKDVVSCLVNRVAPNEALPEEKLLICRSANSWDKLFVLLDEPLRLEGERDTVT
jgi:hypothetical protein